MDGKYIRIIQALYSAATMRVRTPEGNTKSLNVTKGVLQGEILSPFLFLSSHHLQWTLAITVSQGDTVIAKNRYRL